MSTTERPLNENEVVDAVADFVTASGWLVKQKRHGHQRGVDVIARRADGWGLHVEAKGATSSRVGSAKYGQPMGSAEVRINIAEAYYTATAAVSAAAAEPVLSAMALYEDERHRGFVKPLLPALGQLGIGIFWVSGPGRVSLEAPWAL